MRIIASSLILFFLSSICNAETIEYKPLRRFGVGVYGDICSHLNESDVHQDEDKITSGHESLHVLHARIRLKYKKPNAYYLLKDRAFLFSNPKVTLKEVADNVKKRGPNYQLYLVEQQKYWNDTPFYVLDEYIAYIGGCLVGLDEGMEKRSIDSYNHVLEFQEYVNSARELSRKSGFSEQKELDEFLDFVYNNRVLWLEQEYKKLGWLK
jgi:hypothetical protein